MPRPSPLLQQLPQFPPNWQIFSSLAANARQHTRAPRSQKGKEESLCRYLCPPGPTTLFLSPVRRGQKTGRRVALVESPSHHHRLSCPTLPLSKTLIARFSLLLCQRMLESSIWARLMRLGSRSGYYGPYRWLALKKRMATAMSRPCLLLCRIRRWGICIGSICISVGLLHLTLFLNCCMRGSGHIHTSPPWQVLLLPFCADQCQAHQIAHSAQSAGGNQDI